MRRALKIEGKIHAENLSVIDMYKINNTVLKLIKQKPYARRRNRLQELISRLFVSPYTYYCIHICIKIILSILALINYV